MLETGTRITGEFFIDRAYFSVYKCSEVIVWVTTDIRWKIVPVENIICYREHMERIIHVEYGHNKDISELYHYNKFHYNTDSNLSYLIKKIKWFFKYKLNV